LIPNNFDLNQVRTNPLILVKKQLSMSACNQDLFEKINRPVQEVTFERMIDGEIEFRKKYKGKIILEVFLLTGINATLSDVRKIAQFANQIKPDTIHFNTVTRPAAEEFAHSVTKTEMEQFSAMFTPHAKIPPEVSGTPLLNKDINEEKILDLIRRRPVTLKQLVDTFGAHPNEIAKITGKFLRDREIIMTNKNNNKYYQILIENS